MKFHEFESKDMFWLADFVFTVIIDNIAVELIKNNDDGSFKSTPDVFPIDIFYNRFINQGCEPERAKRICNVLVKVIKNSVDTKLRKRYFDFMDR
jgi:hypothetical protein